MRGRGETWFIVVSLLKEFFEWGSYLFYRSPLSKRGEMGEKNECGVLSSQRRIRRAKVLCAAGVRRRREISHPFSREY